MTSSVGERRTTTSPRPFRTLREHGASSLTAGNLALVHGFPAIEWHVRPVRPDEFTGWTLLFQAYCDFYRWPTSEEHQSLVWSWILEGSVMEALVVVALDESGVEVGGPQGLAHVREWVRPLRGVRCGYLDDLFVTPAARGTGAVDALLAELRRLGRQRGWNTVRWTTAPDNDRAIAVYEKVATRTPWVTYDMSVDLV